MRALSFPASPALLDRGDIGKGRFADGTVPDECTLSLERRRLALLVRRLVAAPFAFGFLGDHYARRHRNAAARLSACFLSEVNFARRAARRGRDGRRRDAAATAAATRPASPLWRDQGSEPRRDSQGWTRRDHPGEYRDCTQVPRGQSATPPWRGRGLARDNFPCITLTPCDPGQCVQENHIQYVSPAYLGGDASAGKRPHTHRLWPAVLTLSSTTRASTTTARTTVSSRATCSDSPYSSRPFLHTIRAAVSFDRYRRQRARAKFGGSAFSQNTLARARHDTIITSSSSGIARSRKLTVGLLPLARLVLAAYSLGAPPALLQDILELHRETASVSIPFLRLDYSETRFSLPHRPTTPPQKPMPTIAPIEINESNWTEYLGDERFAFALKSFYPPSH